MAELTTKHDHALLGLDTTWTVTSVEFQPDKKRVEIQIENSRKALSCPGCQVVCSKADMAARGLGGI